MERIKVSRIAFAIATLIVVVLVVWRRHENHALRDAHEAPATLHDHARGTSKHLASIAGTVREDGGVAIAGARVCASATAAASPTDFTRDALCAITSAHGEYTIDNLFAAQYSVSAMAPRFTMETYAPNGPDKPPFFPLAATEQRLGVDLILHRGGLEVTGMITDASGGTIAHAHVRIDANWQRYGMSSVDIESDEHGQYSAWTRVPSVTVTAVADGYAATYRQGNAPAQIDLELIAESTLAGTVVDSATGKPVADVTVYASTADNSGLSASTFTDDNGHFFLDRLRPGRYTAIARSAHGTGQADGSTQLALGEHVDGVAVRLFPAHQIIAHITADGKPCTAGVSAALVDERQNLQPEVTVDADGTLHADGVLPGVYIPSPSCDGFMRDEQYDPIVVTDRDVTATWNVHAGAIVSGRVHTANGEPVPFADVSAQSIDDGARVSSIYVGDRASANGEYTLRGLRPGRYQLIVARPNISGVMGGPAAAQVNIDVSGPLHHDVVLPDLGGTITGVVTTTDKTSPGRVYVQARVPDKDGGPTVVTSDDAGRYEIHDLDPATYELSVLGATDHGLEDNLTSEKPHVTVAIGPPVVANLVIERPNGEIRGHVVDDKGRPVGDAFIGLSFEHDDAPSIRQARGDNDEILAGSDGHFVAPHLSKGSYTVRASRKGGGEVMVAHVPVGSDITVTLAPTAEITGIAHRTGAPIDDLHVTLFDTDTEERFRDESFFRTGGQFAIHDVPAGHYRVVVATGSAVRAMPLDLTEGQHATLDVQLEGVVTLIGRTVDTHTHEPVPGMTVSAYIVGVSMAYLTPADHRNTSDAQGRFEIPNVPRGALEITGGSLEVRGQVFDTVGTHRTIEPTDPDTVDIGTVNIVSSTPGPHGDSGFTIEASGEPREARVTSVELDGAAANAGIYVGDVITAVDGVNVTGADADHARDLVTGDVGIAIQITLARGDTVTLVLAPSTP